MTRVVLGETPFAVVDVEATGIYPGRHDRIIEIAVLRLSPALEIEEEWHTLVNPRRDIGRTDIHGIRAGDVLRAPVFAEIAADAAMRLRDAVVVGHHLRFDFGFLVAEYERAGVRLPTLPGLCTLDLAYQLLPDAPSRKLVYCCEQAGVRHEDEHTALGDARATAALLDRFLEWGRQRRLTTLEALGCRPLHLPPLSWMGGLTATGKRLAREAAPATVDEARSYLARLVERMPGDEAHNAREAEYLALVDRVLSDRRVTPEEAEMLRDMADSWAMTRSDVLDAHRAYLGGLASEAMADGHVSAEERRDLETVCDALGLHRAALDVLLANPPSRAQPTSPTDVPSLRGESVCFTGELLGLFKGERITREVAEKLAAEAGLEVRPSVTKRLDLLVVADPDTQSIKARKAREYGVRIMAEQVFWRSLGIPVDFGRTGGPRPRPSSAPPPRPKQGDDTPVTPAPNENLKTVEEAIAPHVAELRALGWHVELARDTASLHGFLKNGRPRKSAHVVLRYDQFQAAAPTRRTETETVITLGMSIGFDESTGEIVVESKEPTEEVIEREVRVSPPRPYVVSGPSAYGRALGNLWKAAAIFLEQARKHAPQRRESG